MAAAGCARGDVINGRNNPRNSDHCGNMLQQRAESCLVDQREYVACLKCTSDCYSAHASASTARPAIAPSFVKVLDNCSSLEIPRSFADAFLNRCAGEAKLEGPSGWVWYALFRRSAADSCMFFGSPGWDDFAHDHGLQAGDVLVFTYLGKNLFKARIFDAHEGGEKAQHCLPTKPRLIPLTEKRLEDKSDVNTPNREINTPNSAINKSNSEISSDKCDINKPNSTISSHKCKINKPKREIREPISKTKKRNQDDINRKDQKALVFIEARDLGRKQLVLRRTCDGTYKLLKYDPNDAYDPYAVASPWERERVANEANAFHSKNPFVIKSLSASSVYKDRKLVIPSAFCREHMPKRDTVLTLIDPAGKEWTCKWIAHREYNKRLSFVSGGWAGFTRAHELIEHDICIFELVNRKDSRFNVHIYKQRIGPPNIDDLHACMQPLRLSDRAHAALS